MEAGEAFAILISTMLVYNFVLARFLGLCPYMGVSKDTSSAIGMGMAVIFVMTLASAVTWPVYRFLLAPSTANVWYRIFGGDPSSYDLTRVLRTISFILVIAALVQFVEMFIRKVSPGLYRALGIYIALITTNCAVLGVAVLNIDMFFEGAVPVPGSYLKAILQGFGAGIGFTLAMVLMSSIRERLELADVPEPLKGIPIALIVAGLMSMAFLGFAGLI
jgi:electron transport complex protein RnfA